MTDILAKQQERRLYWWGVFVFFTLLSLNSLATSVMGALVGGTDWSGLNGQQKFLIVMAVLANWTGLVIAFVKDVLARLAQGKPPIATGDTQHWQKEK